jgi:hypothetical protein
MKKIKPVKLTVSVEAIRILSDGTLADVNGANGAREGYSRQLYWNCSGARICGDLRM